MKYPVLGVNIDHVATLRQARGEVYPNVIEAAKICEKSDIYCITAHLREDRRHIQDADIYALKEAVSTRLNMEMSLADDIVQIACDVRPYMATLVPERREEITTEGGLDIISHRDRLASVIERLRQKDIVVSLFIEPDPSLLDTAVDLGAEYVEFHTGAYASAGSEDQRQAELDRLYHASREAVARSLFVNAGHGLTLDNVAPVLKMHQLRELNIGHSIVSRALFVGLQNAVEEMLTQINTVRI
ncbi:MAG: pyridoxine 5'-phosphate synthase [Spirochaetota bacterium]